MKRRSITGNPFRLKRSLSQAYDFEQRGCCEFFQFVTSGLNTEKGWVQFRYLLHSGDKQHGEFDDHTSSRSGSQPSQQSTLERYFSLNYTLLVCSLMAFVTKGHYLVRITVALVTFVSKLFWIQIFAILHERMHGLERWFSFFHSIFPEWQFWSQLFLKQKVFVRELKNRFPAL